MSFREITMQDVRELLRRHEAGQSARKIARELGVDRKTVGRYLEQAHKLDPAMATVTDEVALTVGQRVQARPLVPPSEAWQALDEQRTRIEVCPPSMGEIVESPEVGGLHHRYERLAA
jgi:predicted transcriptional regulator